MILALIIWPLSLAGVDYTSVRRTTLRFSETNVRRCVDVQIREDDLLEEEEESFTATLDRPGDGVNIDPELATVSILDETGTGVNIYVACMTCEMYIQIYLLHNISICVYVYSNRCVYVVMLDLI